LSEFDFNGLDTLVHGPIRLGVLTALALDGNADFTSLKRRLDVADGALGMHLQKLEEAGYIHATKRFIGKRPNTVFRITPSGKRAYAHYLNNLQTLLDRAMKAGVLKDHEG
jgi:DNA-binding MarR family transcriptional regulator